MSRADLTKPKIEATDVPLWVAERQDAYHRNEKGYPLSARQAGFVLNITANGVEGLVQRGLLKARWPGSRAPFHPADLGEYLEREALRSETAKREMRKQEPQEATA